MNNVTMSSIDMGTLEGQLLVYAIGKLMSKCYPDKTPDEILQLLYKLNT